MSRSRLSGLAVTLVLLGVTGCSGGQAGSGPEDFAGTATLSLERAPEDARCLRVTAVGRRSDVRDLALSPGIRTTFKLDGLPTGAVSFSGEAFAEVCSKVKSSTVPTWLSEPVVANIEPSPRADVELVMIRNGRGNIGVEFEEDRPLRVAIYNASLNRNTEGELVTNLDDRDHPRRRGLR